MISVKKMSATRLAAEQQPDARIAAREAQAAAEALERAPGARPAGGAGLRAQREHDRDDDERRGVDEQRGREAELGDQQAAERGAADGGEREADVEQRVALAEQVPAGGCSRSRRA